MVIRDGGFLLDNKFRNVLRFKQFFLGLLMGCFIGYNIHSVTLYNDNNNNVVAKVKNRTTTTTTTTHIHNNNNNNNDINNKQLTTTRHQTTRLSSSSSCSSIQDQEEAGWRTVRVFAGDTKLHLQERLKARGDVNRTWFSQNGQDQVVSTLLRNKTNGYFIDLASNDAISSSNTLGLEVHLNWTGLCMEANPFCWYSLAYYRNCQVVGAVVGGPNRTHVDFLFQGATGGIYGREFDNSKARLKTQTKFQITVSLLTIFELHHVPNVIDYLSLDVEGAEAMILEHFPFDRYKFMVLSIERPKPPLKELLQQHGYHLLNDNFTHFGETIWAHESIVNELDKTAFDVSYEHRNDPMHLREFGCV